MTRIDELLARALLLDEPSRPKDIVPRTAVETPPMGNAPEAAPGSGGRDALAAVAVRDLHALCEVLVSQAPATALQGFVTEQLPAPPGARVLGCVLQLADADDGARSWWQYAAGAGDRAAAYCLYLHHLSLGESDAAAWWYQQTQIDTCPTPDHTAKSARTQAEKSSHSLKVPEPIKNLDTSTPTVLRVFRNLMRRADRPRTEVVDALMHYLPTAVAVGYVNDEPDIDLPLPGPDFAERISVLLAAASSISGVPGTTRQRAAEPPLQSRQDHRAHEGSPEHERSEEATEEVVRGCR
ncbi:hypothetical protein OG369_38485 [Streptomyces sp. NBC_01221]|uniref:hypothetical protein n=1 Tax=unclassified Streptomyces TaxID=2593676 RepID=UPI00224E7A8F|nr:hypothetical protein [Streptomyces sp. NBC_01221]MCX4791758.1 hypothetical protein [Streptomyces sp. NBC_01221]WSP53079.1 hypothetical protein OG306_00410 [Streptomyces sp. NBC_01241]WSU26200.1 hypothetical protein OG508_38580 [Streptomyces sp. NBC_01108]